MLSPNLHAFGSYLLYQLQAYIHEFTFLTEALKQGPNLASSFSREIPLEIAQSSQCNNDVKLNGKHSHSKDKSRTSKETHGLSLNSMQSELECEFKIVLILNLGYSNHHQHQG